MSVTVTAMRCGSITAEAAGFIEGGDGRISVPVPCYLIDHPKGRVLFDTGMHTDLQQNSDRIGPFARLFEIRYEADEGAAARLAAVDVDADRLDRVIVSHLHFDHAGGLEQLPNAQVIVQRREWEAGRDADRAQANGFIQKDYDHGHDVLEVDGEHDVFGDGRVTCIPTYGHTPGHQSLRVRTDEGEVVLTADACYFRQTLEKRLLPAFGYSQEKALASLDRLQAFEDAGARLVFGHEPAQWDGNTTGFQDL